MTCQHCVNSVTTEVSAVPGVENVEVDLEAKTVTVVGGEDAAIRAAIDEAGYEVAA
jgi:copper chaperone CopZ